jgi:hypothetical protein
MFPLAALPFSQKPANRVPILAILLGGGASLELALAWLSVGPLFEWRVGYGVVLCRLLSASHRPKALDQITRRWFRQVSAKVNNLPMPSEHPSWDSLLKLHGDLKTVGRLFGFTHLPPPWVTAEWL